MAKKLFNNQPKKETTRRPKTIGDYKRLIAKENRKINLINVISFLVCVAFSYLMAFRMSELIHEISSDSTYLTIIFMTMGFAAIIYYAFHLIFIHEYVEKHEKRIKNYNLKIEDIKFAACEKDREFDQWYKNYRFWKNLESITADFDNIPEQKQA